MGDHRRARFLVGDDQLPRLAQVQREAKADPR